MLWICDIYLDIRGLSRIKTPMITTVRRMVLRTARNVPSAGPISHKAYRCCWWRLHGQMEPEVNRGGRLWKNAKTQRISWCWSRWVWEFLRMAPFSFVLLWAMTFLRTRALKDRTHQILTTTPKPLLLRYSDNPLSSESTVQHMYRSDFLWWSTRIKPLGALCFDLTSRPMKTPSACCPRCNYRRNL